MSCLVQNSTTAVERNMSPCLAVKEDTIVQNYHVGANINVEFVVDVIIWSSHFTEINLVSQSLNLE